MWSDGRHVSVWGCAAPQTAAGRVVCLFYEVTRRTRLVFERLWVTPHLHLTDAETRADKRLCFNRSNKVSSTGAKQATSLLKGDVWMDFWLRRSWSELQRDTTDCDCDLSWIWTDKLGDIIIIRQVISSFILIQNRFCRCFLLYFQRNEVPGTCLRFGQIWIHSCNSTVSIILNQSADPSHN